MNSLSSSLPITHKQINVQSFLHASKTQGYHLCWGVGKCCEGRQCVVGALWCASAGFHLPVLWQPLPVLIENIPWNFLTLPRPRHHFIHVHTYTCVCVCLRHKVIWSEEIFIAEKSSYCQKYTCTIVCFEVWAALDLFAESWFLCVCSAVQAHNSPLCRHREGPCVLQSFCGVVVLKWWLRERVCLACMSLCLRGSSSHSAYLLFSALSPVYGLSASACNPVCL